MGSVSTFHAGSLEKWSPTAFLVAGMLFVGHAVVRGIEAFATTSPPPDVFGPTGYVVALVGLFGLYPTLTDRIPRFARVAAIMAAIPAIGWLVISVWSFGEVAGIVPSQSDVLPGVFFIVVILSTFLTYVLFSVASLRANVHSRTVGALLLAPAAVLVLLIMGVAILEGGAAIGGFIIGSGQTLAHVAIGGALRRESVPTDHESPSDGVSTS